MATIDTGIYSNLLRAPKTVAEYDAEAQAAQQNKLTLQMGRMKADEYTRGIADQTKLRQVVSGFGADKTANYNALLSAGRLTDAQKYAKENAEIEKETAALGKTRAETGKISQETVMHQFEIAGQLAGAWANNPTVTKAQIASGLQAALASGVISEPIAQSKIAELSQLPEDPAALNQWAQGTLQQVMKAKESMSFIKPDANTVANNTQSDVNSQRTAASARYSADSSAASSRYSTDRSAASAAQRLAFDKTKPLDGAGKPIPTAALKMQQAELDAIGTASSIQADLGAIEQQIKDGKLNFGPVNNLLNKGRNMAGISTEESRNMASFKSTIEKLRNDSLRLNTGVQTDGDAQRAWSELIDNINDKGVVTQRLAEIKRINERAVKLRRMNVDGIRANYGRDPLDTAKYEDQPAAIGKSAIPSGWSVKER